MRSFLSRALSSSAAQHAFKFTTRTLPDVKSLGASGGWSSVGRPGGGELFADGPKIELGGDGCVHVQRGPKLGTSVHPWWLLDNDPSKVDPSTKQKMRSSGGVNLKLTIAKAARKRTGDDNVDTLELTWSDGSVTSYAVPWLLEYAPVDWDPAGTLLGVSAEEPVLWRGDEFVQEKRQLPVLDYGGVMGDGKALYAMMEHLHNYGMCFVRNVPTETDESEKLIKRFGGIARETFYGKLWDVVSTENAINIAYTDVELGHHMDLEYFEAPPGLQLLHCLKNKAIGGASTFVDSFTAAKILKDENPEHYQALKEYPVVFHYRRGDHHRRYERRTIEEDGRNEYLRINYAPPFQGPSLLSPAHAARFYPAFAAFEKILAREDMTYRVRLNDGDLVIFNNRRILHGREMFDASSGKRHLRGSYVDMDDYRSTYRMLAAKYKFGSS